MSLLEVRNVTRRFGGVVAVNDVSFSIGEGEIVGFMGANGAGKTTLFSILAGNMKPSSGEILLDGRRIEGLPPEQVNRLGIARTFQIVRPFATMSVLENLTVALLYGRQCIKSPTKARALALTLLEETGLSDSTHKLAGALTLAGRKRLEVARALATNPRLLLLDEVFAGLNASEANDALLWLRQIKETRNLSILIVEHVMKALMRLSHRIVVLHDGHKITEGEPEDIVRDPRVLKAYLGEARP